MLGVVRNAWAQVVSMFLGFWLMAAPAVLGYGGTLADAHRIIGPIAAAFALMAVWGHMRPLRWTNVLFGAVVVVAPFVVGVGTVALANSVVVGLLLVGLLRSGLGRRGGLLVRGDGRRLLGQLLARLRAGLLGVRVLTERVGVWIIRHIMGLRFTGRAARHRRRR